MILDFNPQLLKSSEKFLDNLERQTKALNKDNRDSLKEIRLLQSEINELMQDWEV